jgi:hypothetical protein
LREKAFRFVHLVSDEQRVPEGTAAARPIPQPVSHSSALADQPSKREITNLSGIDAPAAFIAIARHVFCI